MFSPNGIKTILFDLDGTLRLNLPAGWEIFIDHALSLGLSVNNADRLRGARWEHYYWAGSPELFDDLNTHVEHGAEFWLNYSRRQLLSLGVEAKRAEELAPLVSKYMERLHMLL